MRLYPARLHTLDYQRCEELVLTHYDGCADKLTSISRALLPLETADQIGRAIDTIDRGIADMDGEFVAINNRFNQPAPSGYRDLKALVKAGSDHISTMRYVHTPTELETFFPLLQIFWSVLHSRAVQFMKDNDLDGPAVIIADNYLKDDCYSCILVTGFSEDKWAAVYAMYRMKDSLRRIRECSFSTDDLKFSWMMLGEDCARIGRDCSLHISSPNIMAIVAEMNLPDKYVYLDIEDKFNLQKSTLR